MTESGLKWTKGPSLLIGRSGHRSINIENQIYHIGEKLTERWTIEENKITLELLDLDLKGYYAYPEVFAVDRNYC